MTTDAHGALRRQLMLALAALPVAANAQSPAWPSRPVQVLIPYSPGGATDAVARVAAQQLGVDLKGTFLVENRPGGSGTIAMSQVARAQPDGYTLYMNEITSTVVGVLVPNLSFDPIKDLVPICLIAETPFVLVVNGQVPVTDLKSFIAYAKANPGKVNFGSGGVGSGPHIAGELFKSLAKVDIRHVPYKGSGPALQDVLGGQIEMLITAAPTVAAQLKDGRLKALAVARNERLKVLPQVPTAAEAGLPGFEISNWFGLASPKGLSETIVKQLASAVQAMVKNPDVLERFAAAGAEPLNAGPEAARQRVASESERWSALIKSAGVKNDNT